MSFFGNVEEIPSLLSKDRGRNAVFFASLNAIASKLNIAKRTVHCKEDDPKKCGEELKKYILDEFGRVKIAHIGYQPGHLESCSKHFESYVTDLDSKNIGSEKYGRKILDGEKNEEVIKRVDVACMTGSTLINESLPRILSWCKFYDTEPVVHGVTANCSAKLLNLKHFCPFRRESP